MNQSHTLHLLVSKLANAYYMLRFNRTYRNAALIGVTSLLFLAILTYTIAYLWPNTTVLSYASDNCVSKPTILPSLHKLQASNGLAARFDGLRRIGSYPIFSNKACATMTQAPRENTQLSLAIHPLGLPFITHATTFASGSYPAATPAAKTALSGLISTQDTLTLPLNKPDSTFEYALAGAGKTEHCTKHLATIRCNVAALKLKQAKTYELSVVRSFKNQEVGAILTNTVQTVTPINIVGSSIKPNQNVYDAPKDLTLTFDKPLAQYSNISLKKSDGTPVAFTTRQQDTKLVITFKDPLPRSTPFQLSVSDVRATDKGFLQNPYTLTFTTSGGPKVTGKNIGSYDIGTGTAIRLTFDVAVSPDNADQFIQIRGNGGQIPATVTVAGNIATITPRRNFERCEAFSVTVSDGLKNTYGITGSSAYTYASRSTCRSIFSIGTSAEGRAITAYKFGTGASAVLYIGGTHGDEGSSATILDSWVSYLESVAPSIPAHRSIVVIPRINPDGLVRGSRTNAHNVDLNRNFPANNWKADVTVPGGQLIVNGGGTSALSEPESAALANYTLALQPRLVLTYHSKGSIVTANESGDSMMLATAYGRKTSYWAVAESQLGSTFNYDTTGAYENWLHDKVGIPALLIELPAHSGNYFSRNRDAMWYMVGL